MSKQVNQYQLASVMETLKTWDMERRTRHQPKSLARYL